MTKITFDKITKPANCLLAIALPLTKVDFINDLDNENKDYARSRNEHFKQCYEKDALWEIDHLPFIQFYNKTKKELIGCGLNIIENFKIADLKEIDKFDVTTFITHSIKEKKQVEFYDGLFYDFEFVENMPTNYEKIIDLTICNSTFLIEIIKNKYTKCNIIANENSANLEHRLALFKYLIKTLYKGDLNYIEESVKVRSRLRTTY